MKITIFTSALILGGTERVASNLANELVKNGHEVEILSLFHVDKPAYELDNRVSRYELTSDDGKAPNRFVGIYRHIKRYFALIKYTRKSDTDKYLVMLRLPVYMLLSLKGITFNSPVVFSERGTPEETYAASRMKKWISKRLLKRANGAVFQTDYALNYYSNEYLKCKGVVILNPINEKLIEASTTASSSDYEERAFICVGRLTTQKNQKLLLKAFSLIHSKVPEYSLKLIGTGEDKSMLVELSRDLGIIDKVVFTGKLDNYKDIYRKGNIFVLSSLHEGLPNALIEAMVMGLPCVSTDCAGMGPRFLIEDGINGFLVPLNNEVLMADRMLILTRDKQLASTLGNNAKKLREKVEPNLVFSQWIDYLLKVNR